MAKLCLKKTSKRVSCKKRYKIEKKVREHSKKMKKSANKNEQNKKRKPDKLISVPNKCPFKEEILIEAEKKREEIKEQGVLKKKLAKVEKKKNPAKDKSIEALKQRAQSEENSNTTLGHIVDSLEGSLPVKNEKTLKNYAGEVRKTIESADVVIEVLDARDPLGSRSTEIEQLVVGSGKRLILLLNKIDLVPKENLVKWLAYLRLELPTIAFKASTQEQNQKLGHHHLATLKNFSSKCVGASLLLKLLGNYCRNKDIKTSIRVGIVGYPNVGKSSIINSLKRKKSCQTGDIPGLTKQIQEVELDKHVRLLDSPGVVLASKGAFDAKELALKNALRVESLSDPVAPVHAILRRCSVKALMLHYNIPEFEDCDQFLALVARRLGRMRKGGRADLNAAAKNVLKDWNSGKLRYYTEPPEKGSSADEKLLDADIVSSFSKEFDLEALDGDIRTLVDEMPDQMVVDNVYDPSVPVEKGSSDGGEEMETDAAPHGKTVVPEGGGKKKGKKVQSAQSDGEILPKSLAIDGNVQLNTAIKKAIQKRKKKQQKLANRTEKLADNMAQTLGGDIEMDE
jgi:nuclear GTP-binding protein